MTSCRRMSGLPRSQVRLSQGVYLEKYICSTCFNVILSNFFRLSFTDKSVNDSAMRFRDTALPDTARQSPTATRKSASLQVIITARTKRQR